MYTYYTYVYLYDGCSIPNLHTPIYFLLRDAAEFFLRHLHAKFSKQDISAAQTVLGNQSVLEPGDC